MARERQVIRGVRIVDTGHKGAAVGKAPDGRTLFVEGGVPGDVLDARPVRKRKGVEFCIPERYITHSEFRTDPFCAHFGICGGCKWQHMHYEAQLAFKEKSVRDALTRIGGIPDVPIRPIIGCDPPTYYRNKLEFTFTDRRWLTPDEIASGEDFERRGLGFHVGGSFAHVVDVEHCYLQGEPSNAIRDYVKDYARKHDLLFQNVRHHQGLLRNLIIRTNMAGHCMVTFVLGKNAPAEIQPLFDALTQKFDEITACFYCVNEKLNDSVFDLEFVHVFGDPYLKMQLGHIEYLLGPKSFFQTNSRQAGVLCDVVEKFAGLTGGELVYDLYCGVGSFALYLARRARHIAGIEEVVDAVADARTNASHNNLDNLSFYAGDVREVILREEVMAHGRPDVIITDPPRAGMHASVLQALLMLEPQRIVYVSCDPATQARDIRILAGRYRVGQNQPVDMFPHTAHVENVALLERQP